MKLFHTDIYDDGLNVIITAAAGPNLKLVLCSAGPTTRSEAATLHDGAAGKMRVSNEIDIASGDVSLATKGDGAREITVAAKTGSVAVDIPTADSGTATSGGAATLTDTSKAWTVDAYAGKVVKITSGTGAGQTGKIASNTDTVLTVDTNWATPPDATSVYQILEDLHYALYDDTRLLYVSDESSNQALTTGNSLPFPSFKVGFNAP